MAYTTFKLRIKELTIDGVKPKSVTVTVYPMATNTTKLKVVKDTTGGTILSGHATHRATPAEITAGVVDIDLPDPRDESLSPFGFGFRVKVQTNYFGPDPVTFGPVEIANVISGGVVILEDVTPSESVAFEAQTVYATGGELAGEAAARVQGDADTLEAALDGATADTAMQVSIAIENLIAGAPGALDTLLELADQLGDDESAVAGIVTALGLKAPLASPAFTGTPTGITKTHVGLGNADNTSDVNKPVSTAQAAADATTLASAATDATTKAGAAQSAAATDATSKVTTETSRATAAEATLVARANRPVNLAETAGINYSGVVGTPATYTSAAVLQAAINAGGAGSLIELGRGGRIVSDGPITTPNYSILRSTSGQMQGAGFTAPTEICFPTLTGSQVGITLGLGGGIEDILVRGPGFASSCIGVLTTSSGCYLKKLQCFEWGIGLSLPGVFYGDIRSCAWRFNGIAVDIATGNNINFSNCRFECRSTTAAYSYGAGVRLGASTAIQPLTFSQCSFENYGGASAPAIDAGYHTVLNLLGCYFESSDAGAVAGGTVGVTVGHFCVVNAIGNMVSLQEANRFISGGSASAGNIYARGNKFACSAGSSTTPIAYFISTGLQCDIDDDNYELLLKGTSGTIASVAGHSFPILTGNPPVGSHYFRGKALVPARLTTTFAAAQTVDFTSGPLSFVTLTANWTSLTLAGGVSNGDYELHVIQDGTGSRTLSSPAATIKWAGGSTPTLTTTPAGRDVFRFRFDGTNYVETFRSRAEISGAAATAQAYAIQRANHTGTQLAATISDFSTAADLRVAAAAPATTQYTTAQTDTIYTIPTGAQTLKIRLQAGGGGGGSARRGAAGSVRCGGGGGSAGGYTEWDIRVADLASSTLYVTVGAGGAGGAAVTANDTSGNPGVTGGLSSVRTSTSAATIANTVAWATGGNLGSGGTAATGTGGSGVAGRWSTAAGGTASTTGLVGVGGSGVSSSASSGGSGGGLTTGDAQSAGGAGAYAAGRGAVSGVVPTAGTAGGGNGGPGLAPPVLGYGQGGAGGGSSAATAGGAGGVGVNGGGGGGGGASLNGNNSGAGGDGGTGFVEIVAVF